MFVWCVYLRTRRHCGCVRAGLGLHCLLPTAIEDHERHTHPRCWYEVEVYSKKYQVEIEILENTEQYVHVMVAVDDGSIPASILPVTLSFIRKKSPARV